MTSSNHSATTPKGRGATDNPDNRYSEISKTSIDDGWDNQDEPIQNIPTELIKDSSKSILTYNQSPDVPFDRSINPYRGCEHGCIYCFARPTHAFLDMSPGLDFETKIVYKPHAVKLLRKQLASKNYICAPVSVGINTDAYQPVERKLNITRGILELLVECNHPFSIVTKSSLIERDIDLIAGAAEKRLASIAVSVTTLDRTLSRRMEPRAAAPQRRLQTIKRLSEAGIPVSVLLAPVIPALNDNEIEDILAACRDAGAQHAGYVVLRLPHELKDMFRDWLNSQVPLKAARVMNRMRDLHGGRDYEASFGQRMTGKGVFAQLIEKRFLLAEKQLEYGSAPELDCSQFVPPGRQQMRLF